MLRGKSPKLTLLAPEQRAKHMPRLFHRPPKYSLHKGTKQAVVSLRGKRIYLGPFGSAQSHAAYQEVLQNWYKGRDVTLQQKPAAKAASVSAATLREKRRAGSPLAINELVLVWSLPRSEGQGRLCNTSGGLIQYRRDCSSDGKSPIAERRSSSCLSSGINNTPAIEETSDKLPVARS